MAKETKRYFLQRAHHATQDTLSRGRFMWSLKLDGMRAYWDGGLTRGRQFFSFNGTELATGLYTINGNIMHAPAWFLDDLPPFPMEGEMWAGVGKFQKVMSICKKQYPHEGWRDIVFNVYDFPRPAAVFMRGDFAINNQKTRYITADEYDQVKKLVAEKGENYSKIIIFNPAVITQLGADFPAHGKYWKILEQYAFDGDLEKFQREIFPTLLDAGHEGVMFRRIGSVWTNTRTYAALKLKPFHDAEGTVIGFVAGKETDRGSRNLGRIGALIVWCEKFKRRVKVSGLEDVERSLTGPEELIREVEYHPGNDFLKDEGAASPLAYPYGTTITFKYRELTDDGAPKDARIWRLRPDE